VAWGPQYPITVCIDKYSSSRAVRQGQKVIDKSVVSVILRRYASLLNGPRAETRGRCTSKRQTRPSKSDKMRRTGRIYGRFRKWPINGSWRRKVRMTGKKSLEPK
jgi:hypothetical protein